MRIHLIAIGGAVMHNLAISLQKNGHVVSGSDDEIYNPAYDRLSAAGLLPEVMGWRPDRIDSRVDAVILGMHARADNPELLYALELGLPVFSYPEFVYEHARDKQRLAVAGSHGKTTTTAMVMHALRRSGMAFDYLVGAQLDGFDTMVALTGAPLLVVEADEYLSSPIDPRPKMVHYRPHAAALTGIAWDHVNVFPRFEDYLQAFAQFVRSMEPGEPLYYPAHDPHFEGMLAAYCGDWMPADTIPFTPFAGQVREGVTYVHTAGGRRLPLRVFGEHNLLNARAAALLCAAAGVPEDVFLEALTTFSGAGRRLQVIAQGSDRAAWLDFAHAPSKVLATTRAVKQQFPGRRLVAGVELHTFSSLNRAFLPFYRHTLDAADRAFVFFSPETLLRKQMPALEPEYIQKCFGHPDLRVFTDAQTLSEWLAEQSWEAANLLLMSSGHFGGWNISQQAPVLLQLDNGQD